jgi:hypothetical protein
MSRVFASFSRSPNFPSRSRSASATVLRRPGTERQTQGESPGGVSPPGARRTVRERLRSYGSHQPAAGFTPRRCQCAKRTASLGSTAPPAHAVARPHKLADATPSLHRVSPTSPLLRVAPSLCLASVRSSSWVRHLDLSLRIEATGSHVPPKGLAQSHATSMPGVIQAGYSLPLDCSRANDSSRFRHRPYAFDTFMVVHRCSSL